MGKVIDLPLSHPRAIRAAMWKVQTAFEFDVSSRRDSLGLLEQSIYRLITFVPDARLGELARSLQFITCKLDLNAANLHCLLICCQVLEGRYIAESAKA
jgi:hypothetical protein